MMWQHLTMFDALLPIGTMGVSIGLIWLLRPLLRRYALVRPNARSSHQEPTPQGGGIAVVLTTIGATALIAWGPFGLGEQARIELLPVLAATALITLTGAVDDIRPLPVAPRLLLQVLAVALIITTLSPALRILPTLPLWLERFCLVLGGIWFVNLTNFMDGIDWMTVAAMVPITAGSALLGVLGAVPEQGLVVALVLLGALLGFAPFNRPVARLFLGDVGSLPIGLMVGWLLILLAGQGHFVAALLLPLYYLADASITLLSRIKNSEPIWQPHRKHFYQRAIAGGFTVMEVVNRVFITNFVLVILAVLTILIPLPSIKLMALLTGSVIVGRLLMQFAKGRS